MQIIVKRSDLT